MDDALNSKTVWDRLGIGLSGLCAVHCLLFPIVMALLPLWPVAESIHLWSHPVLFLLIVPTVWLALRNGGYRHRRVSLLLLGGLATVGVAGLLHDWTGIVASEWGEALITLTGSVLLINGHWLNYRSHRRGRGASQVKCAL